ncbi:hypothetical protein [Pseudomonas kurunegalensis]|uniref:hypothetical protein n=1 Tax=Pseudomonas kurunegalensis TaxID=485880 RepID=UPI0035584591
MPTENRSSNTELSKIVTEALVGMVSGVTGMKPPADEPLPGFIQAPIDRAIERIASLLALPTEQHQGEPVWFMIESGLSVMHAKDKAHSDLQGWDTSAYRVPLYAIYKPAECVRCKGG